MNRSVSFKPAGWAMAALTAAVMAGCGGGGGGSAPAATPVTPPATATGPNVCNSAAAHCVNLATSANYAVLAQSSITSSATASSITGNVGLSPGVKANYVGFTLTDDGTNTFSTDPQVTGKIFAADNIQATQDALTTAEADAQNAFIAAGALTADVSPGGTTIDTAACAGAGAGVYHFSGAVSITQDCVLTGGADDIWVFQIPGALTQDAATHVTLAGGAQAKNVLWQVDGGVNVGAGSHLEGVVLSSGAIGLGAGASATGRLLTNGAVTVDGSTVAQP
jgi:Ice-binding-like